MKRFAASDYEAVRDRARELYMLAHARPHVPRARIFEITKEIYEMAAMCVGGGEALPTPRPSGRPRKQ
jgi:hypothetical protein